MQEPTTEQRRFSVRGLLGVQWNPQPVEKPKVEGTLEGLHPLQRSAESIRYSILTVEFWLSPDGQLRAWLRNNTRLAVILATPAFLVLPIVTFALWQLVSWLVALSTIAGKMIVIPVLVLIAVVTTAVAYLILKAIFAK